MIHPSHQLSLPAKYLSTLSPSDISVKYSTSDRAPKLGFWDKIKMFVNPQNYY